MSSMTSGADTGAAQQGITASGLTRTTNVATAVARPRPYAFPMDATAVLILKMQREFLDEGGYGSLLGNDVNLIRSCIPNVVQLLGAARAAGMRIIHVKESHKADLSDAPSSKLARTRRQSKGLTIGDKGPLGRVLIEGEEGNDFIKECQPLPGELVCSTPSKGILYNTHLHAYCYKEGISHLILGGVTAEVGVQLVMRELNDRGFEPCLVSDCTASYFPLLKEVALDMIVAQGGIVGWTATLRDVVHAMQDPKEQLFCPRPDWVPATTPLLLPPPSSSHRMVRPEAQPDCGRGVATIQDAAPLPFSFPVDTTACLVIDMQRDFIQEGGFGSTLGNDVKRLQAIINNVSFLQRVCRDYNIPVIHTLEAHIPDLSDCPVAKLTRGQLPAGLRIGDQGSMGRILIRHQWGNDIIDENAPLEGEKVIHKPAKGAFCATDLHDHLMEQGITHLLFAGVTTEVCVQTSLREANDRGFECVMVQDCTESYIPHFKDATISMVAAQGAIVGWAATSADILKSLRECCGPAACASS